MKILGYEGTILPKYREDLYSYKTRVEVFYGGAGSGKSYYVIQKLFVKSISLPRRKVLVVRKVGNSLRDSVYSLFMEIVGKVNQKLDAGESLISGYNRTDMTIRLVSGSEWIFKGLDDVEKLKSINGVTDIIVEEATEITLDDFTQLNLRLRSQEPYNQIHLMFNPVSKANWVYKYFFLNKPSNCKMIKSTYEDNTFLPEEYVESLNALRDKNPAYWRIYALGDFATLDKLVFPKYEKTLVSKETVEGKTFICGLDFGYTNDPSAIVCAYADMEKKKLWVTGEYEKTGMTNDELARVIISLGLQKERIIADCAEPKSIAELKKLGISRVRPCKKGGDSVRWGLMFLNSFDITIDERCVHTIEEFENYTWVKDKNSGEYKNEPVDSFNHCIDALRYASQLLRIKKQHADEDEFWGYYLED